MQSARHAEGQGRTVQLALIGRGIALSRTPAMHEAEGAAQGLDCRYGLIDIDTDASGLAAELDRAEAAGFAGLNVTYPYKQQVMRFLHELSDAARQVGAVNTVVFRYGRRYGHNTDFRGFAGSLAAGLPGADMGSVLLIGAGGAGGAVAHALRDAGAEEVLIHDARMEAAEGLASALRAARGRAEAVSDLTEAASRAKGIVNATPVGMAKLPGTSIDTALIEPRHWVADIIYFPLETALLRHARAIGCRTLGGEGMAVLQAVRAFELFTGLPADEGRMAATFRSLGEAAA